MPTRLPDILLKIKYEETAEAYQRSLPLEHYMESTQQGRQRAITLASFALVSYYRPEIQLFNELLIQYPLKRPEDIHQVVPDNMVVVWSEPIKALGSFNVPFQPAGPLVVMVYVSKSNKRKDYDESLRKYERELKIPYYLLFYPDNQELTLFKRNGRKYVSVKPDKNGRHAIPELELEVALLGGWIRFWFRGKLLPLPADLQAELDKVRKQADDEKRRADDEKRRADKLEEEVAVLRAQLEKAQAANANGAQKK